VVYQAEQPVNLLRVDGRPCKMRRNQEQYDAVESMQGMLPWNGQQDNLIDRFDGRALLDFLYDPPRVHPPKSDKERQLEEVRVLPSLARTVCP
jgi:splicing factor, arginine/serine-rich 16